MDKKIIAVFLVLFVVYLLSRSGSLPSIITQRNQTQPTLQSQRVYLDIKDAPSPKVYIRIEKIGLVTDDGIYLINRTGNPLELNLTEMINNSRTVGAVVLKPNTNITHVIICIERVIIFTDNRNHTFYRHKFYSFNKSMEKTVQLNFSEWEKVEEELREREKKMWSEGKRPPWYTNTTRNATWYNTTQMKLRFMNATGPLGPRNLTLNSTYCILVPVHIVILPVPAGEHHVVVDINIDIDRTILTGESQININIVKE